MRRSSVRVGEFDMIVERLGHFARAIDAHNAGKVGQTGLWHRKGLAEAAVEAAGNLARQLEMRQLILTNGHGRRLV